MAAVLICAAPGVEPVVIVAVLVAVLVATALETAADWAARTAAWEVLEDIRQLNRWSTAQPRDQSRWYPRQPTCTEVLHRKE